MFLWQKKKILKVLDLISKERVLFTVELIEKKVPILVLQNIKITLMHFNSIFLLISGECIFFINIQTQNLKSIKHSEIFTYFIFVLRLHSSEKWGFYFMKWPSETLQNLPYFWNTKIPYVHTFFSFFHFINRPVNSLGSAENIFYNICSTKWKRIKPRVGFHIITKIYDKAFCLAISSSISILFLRSNDVILW